MNNTEIAKRLDGLRVGQLKVRAYATSETPREYKDWDGNPIALSKLVRLEPGWAVSQIMHRDQLERDLATVTRERNLAADQLKGTCSLNRLLREEKDKLKAELKEAVGLLAKARSDIEDDELYWRVRDIIQEHGAGAKEGA
jgi:hypothetical protein